MFRDDFLDTTIIVFQSHTTYEELVVTSYFEKSHEVLYMLQFE